jgi:hypothetical protein
LIKEIGIHNWTYHCLGCGVVCILVMTVCSILFCSVLLYCVAFPQIGLVAVFCRVLGVGLAFCWVLAASMLVLLVLSLGCLCLYFIFVDILYRMTHLSSYFFMIAGPAMRPCNMGYISGPQDFWGLTIFFKPITYNID